jgi:3-hydroxyisobutyrate dehydrogenase-like beta-hydroxyacid dehydrogenase
MVARLVAGGHDVTVLGRSDEKRSTIAELGADAVGEIAAVVATADVVVICVFTDEQVREICLTDGLIAAMPSGSALVLHTTGSPHTVETIAERAAPHDVDVVDAPVSGGPHNAAAGELTLFVGGADHTVARVRPVLSCYGDPILHVGPRGAGQKVKLVNNALFAAHLGLLANSVELAARLGVENPRCSPLCGTGARGAACWTSSRPADPWRPSSKPQANSSAKTSQWSGASPRNSAATSARSTTSSMRQFRESDEAFSTRNEPSTVSVTVEHSVVTLYAAHWAVRRVK